MLINDIKVAKDIRANLNGRILAVETLLFSEENPEKKLMYQEELDYLIEEKNKLKPRHNFDWLRLVEVGLSVVSTFAGIKAAKTEHELTLSKMKSDWNDREWNKWFKEKCWNEGMNFEQTGAFVSTTFREARKDISRP